MTKRATALVLVAALAAGCAKKQKTPPLPFVKTTSFREVQLKTFGVLSADLDGDGDEDALTIERGDEGYRAVVHLRQQDEKKGETWSVACRSVAIAGEELRYQWVQQKGQRFVAVVAATETPDDSRQRLMMVRDDTSCNVAYQTELLLTKGDAGMENVELGVRLGSANDWLEMTHSPEFLHLRGFAGAPQSVLMGVVRRQLEIEGDAIKPREDRIELGQRPATVSWTPQAGRPSERQEVGDRQSTTQLALRAGEAGVLEVSAERKFQLMQLEHGCREDAPLSLELWLPDESLSYTVGQAPPENSFVTGYGASVVADAGVFRDLILLVAPQERLRIKVGPQTAARCLREIKVYGAR